MTGSVTIPRFVSASSNKTNTCTGKKDDVGDADAQIFSSIINGDMDFDLLAEFLLDDGSDKGPSPVRSSGAIEKESEVSTVSVGASSASDIDEIHADPLADAFAAASNNEKDGKIHSAVNVLAKDLMQIESIFASEIAGKSTSSAVADTVKSSSKVKTEPTKGKRKISDSASMVVLPSMPVIPTSNMNATFNGMVGTNSRSQQRQKSQAQIDRRRERNRILARRTRLRKKYFFESLQKEVTDLQRENKALKNIIRTKVSPPTKAAQILMECKSKNEIPSIVYENVLGSNEMDKQDFSLVQSLQGSQQCFVITDPSLQDNPIVYASGGFLKLTGYSKEDVLGRNCRFLQGPDSCPQKIQLLKKAVMNGEDTGVCLANYTSDGTPFWNQVFIAALRDAHNNVVNYVGVLSKVAGPSPDDPEYGKVLQLEGKESKPHAEASKQEGSVKPSNSVDDMLNLAMEAVGSGPGSTR